MDRGLYTAASAGLYQLRRLEVVNNNLANINTPGFKKQLLTGEAQSFDQTLASAVAKNDPFAKGDHDRVPAVINVQSVTDFSQGPIKATGNMLDVALRNAKDFFVVNTPEGQTYTRAGDFTLNVEGELVTQDGMQVLGDGGPIVVNGIGARINADGSVTANGQTVGRLGVVRIEDTTKLERIGSTRFRLAKGSEAPAEVDAQLEPQALEMANVTAVSSMVELINTQRAFQAYTKTADTVDQLNQMAINQIGRVR